MTINEWLAPLSARQREVLDLIVSGDAVTVRDQARRLGITHEAVRKHRSEIYRRLGLHHRVQGEGGTRLRDLLVATYRLKQLDQLPRQGTSGPRDGQDPLLSPAAHLYLKLFDGWPARQPNPVQRRVMNACLAAGLASADPNPNPRGGPA